MQSLLMSEVLYKRYFNYFTPLDVMLFTSSVVRYLRLKSTNRSTSDTQTLEVDLSSTSYKPREKGFLRHPFQSQHQPGVRCYKHLGLDLGPSLSS